MNGHRCFCPACGVSFKSQRNLRVHKQRASMGELSKCNMLVASKMPVGRHADASNDNYSTPKWAWRELFQAVPLLKKRRLWDPFYNDGLTATCWKQLGVREFVHGRGDFFKRATTPQHDVVVTNPPFSKKQLVVLSLLRRGKPFILLLRTSVLFTQWFRRLLPTVKLVFPSRQVDFDAVNGKKLTFDCVFVCHGCGPRSSLFMCPFRG